MKKIYILVSLCLVHAGLFAQAGALDKTFANGGKFLNTTFPVGTNFYTAYKVLVQADGKILLAGWGRDDNAPYSAMDMAIMRLNADGTIDNSFSDDGVTFLDFSSGNGSYYSDDYANNMVLQPDGKIVLAGYSFHYIYDPSTDTYNLNDVVIARLNADGTLDNSFNGNGKKIIDLSPLTGSANGTKFNYDYAYGCVINAAGKIDIAGFTNVYDISGSSTYDAAVLQLNPDGSFDNSFDGDGIYLFNDPASDEYLVSALINGDGKLVLGGGIYSYTTGLNDLLVKRLNTDGSPDNSFGTVGNAIIDGGSASEFGSSLAIQEDQKILLGGYFTTPDYYYGFLLARLNMDGSSDNDFSNDGVQTYFQQTESNLSYNGLSVQGDGKIIQVGRTLSNSINAPFEGSSNYEIIRYNANGNIDNGFGNHGRSVIDFGNWTDAVSDNAITCDLQQDGKIIVAGSTFSYLNGNYYDGVSAVKLLAEGENVSISAPPDQNVQAADGECGVVVNDIDPILDPSNSTDIVNYELYGATKGTGTGKLSGSRFNIGATTAIYSLADKPLNRAVFSITVNPGNNSIGGALDFDGVNDRVNLGNIYSYNYGQYSFEAWIKLRAYTNDDGLGSWIFGNERNGNGGIQVQLDTSGYITTFHPSFGFVKSTYKVQLDAWTHIAFVQSYSDLKLYVNGDYVETLLTAPYLHITYLYYEPFLLGAFSSDFVNYTRQFNGEMDEVRFWNKAICQAQIQNNLHCEISGFADGLVAYYKMNQGITNCSNSEINYLNNEFGNRGTLENFALDGSVSNWVQGYATGSCAPFTPLSIVCPEPINIELEPGECGAVVNFNATAIAGCSPNVTVSYSQDPGTYFNAGTTNVYVYAYDDQGNAVSCSFPVTLTEHEPPVLVTKNASVALDMYAVVYIDPYTVIESVTDNCGLDYYSVYSYPNYFNCSNIGDNLVTVVATDRSGNSTTQYATVTIKPYITTATVEMISQLVQYSDLATYKAVIKGGTNFYYNGCMSLPQVTFKSGNKVLGTVPMQPDYLNNYSDLFATLDAPVLSGDTGSDTRKLTAIFSDAGNAIEYNTEAYTKINARKEDAGIEYTAAQYLTTACSTCVSASIPFSAVITDTADMYRGDISNASATITITAVTAGASVIGDNSISIPLLTLVNNKHTSGIVKGKFNVSVGSQNKKARFDIAVKVGNYYAGNLKTPVFVSRGSGALIDEFVSTSPYMKKTPGKVFDVTAMPNPTKNQFILKIQSSDLYEKINLKITDIAGRVIETKQNININENVQLGHSYKAGTYMVEITQGQNHKLIRLVKL